MDQSAVGAIHVCRKLGWEYTKAHLDLFQHIAREMQEALARQAMQELLYEREQQETRGS